MGREKVNRGIKKMLNVYTIKKWAALIIPSLFSVVSFVIGVQYYNFWVGLLLFVVTLGIMAVLANLLLYNPFTALLQGKGILLIDMNSTGIMRPAIVNVRYPYLKGKVGGRAIEDVFDRESVVHFANPILAEKHAFVDENNNVFIKLSKDEFNKSRWGLYQYPVLIYNSMINSILTKDWFSELEKTVFSEHIVLYLNRKLEELSMYLRDFGRYIVEQTKPKTNWWQNKWVKWVLIGGIVLILILLAPKIISMITGNTGSAVGSAVSSVAQKSVVTPVP